MSSDKMNIWILVNHRQGTVEKETYGLAAEAQRLLTMSKQNSEEYCSDGKITAVALGAGLDAELKQLGAYGINSVVYAEGQELARYNGELFAEVLLKLYEKYKPACILMDHNTETSDLAPRLASLMNTSIVTRVIDFTISINREIAATRPVSSGYLFEKFKLERTSCPVITLLPNVLNETEAAENRNIEIINEKIDPGTFNLKTKVTEIMEAAPEDLEIDEAEIVISGGRGVGKEESLDIITRLAKSLKGSVGGTRPIIDWQLLPFERQIGQTGKVISPRLLFACGISGANEYTTGMEKSRLVVAINTDPGARIFKFADLSVIGDVHEVLPRVIEKIEERGIWNL
ncbi:MAG: electron transfer flavoprotein subunit alpha/FixB family protein [Spirochaetes bacterium]|nr:electron transfer flavoprotein subunit alpha/FixB family protein [Spirochaetota bacterium]